MWWLLVAGCVHGTVPVTVGGDTLRVPVREDLGPATHGVTDVKLTLDQAILEGEGDACRVRSVDVSLDVLIHLPAAPTPALREHERGHAWLAAAVADGVRRDLVGLGCDTYLAASAAAIARLDRVQAAFDLCTGQGLGPVCDPADVLATTR